MHDNCGALSMVVTSHLPEAEHFLGHPDPRLESPTATNGPSILADALSAIDALVGTYRDQQSAPWHSAGPRRPSASSSCETRETLSKTPVKPALSVVAHRLQRDGGDALVVERPANGRHGQRITLWMSPQGDLAEAPRVDRFPYLQLDVDVPSRAFKVWEGTMWHERGASRATESFTLETLSADSVTQRAIGVLRRVVALDARPLEQEL